MCFGSTTIPILKKKTNMKYVDKIREKPTRAYSKQWNTLKYE